MPNVMAALPNIGGALCSTPQSLADAHYYSVVRKPLKFAGVPQTTGRISAASGPKFTILWGHVEETLLLNKLCDGAQIAIFGDFLLPVYSASRPQHVSDLHSKFALGPHHVSKYGRHPISDR